MFSLDIFLADLIWMSMYVCVYAFVSFSNEFFQLTTIQMMELQVSRIVWL